MAKSHFILECEVHFCTCTFSLYTLTLKNFNLSTDWLVFLLVITGTFFSVNLLPSEFAKNKNNSWCSGNKIARRFLTVFGGKLITSGPLEENILCSFGIRITPKHFNGVQKGGGTYPPDPLLLNCWWDSTQKGVERSFPPPQCHWQALV